MTAKKKKRRTARAPSGGGAPRVKLTATRVPINRQGYDSHGRYWGTGEKLYSVEVWDPSTEQRVEHHARAPSARAAKEQTIATMLGSFREDDRDIAARARRAPPPQRTRQPSQRFVFPPVYATPTEGQLGAVNMEGLSDGELAEAQNDPRYSAAQRDIARWLIIARKHRLAGRIEQALRAESNVEFLYERLPEEFKW